MKRASAFAVLVFAAAVLAGTILDSRGRTARARSGSVLVADLHVHPYPGDGSLPTWELQREAARRGLDVVAITGHNNRFGLVVGRLRPLDPQGPILIPGQEITTPSFHMIAVGIDGVIDWRLTARQAIAAIHAQGGVAIAAHPMRISWRVDDEEALRALDGTEVAHSSLASFSHARRDFEEFFARVQSVNPSVAPIGSSDFHMTAPLGFCRTYLIVDERSATGALDALRQGRTVAADPRGQLVGSTEHVQQVKEFLARRPATEPVTALDRSLALTALLALAVLALPGTKRR